MTECFFFQIQMSEQNTLLYEGELQLFPHSLSSTLSYHLSN